MRSPSRQGLQGPLGVLLYCISLMYGLVMRIRLGLYKLGLFPSGRPRCQVVSVGNITVGGTGKTPMTIYLAQYLKDLGVSVAIASRGYGGTMQKAGGVVSDGQKVLLSPKEAGDEPWLMASKLEGVPVVVGGNRVRSAELCVSRFGTQVLLLDDAFSHLAIARDVNLLLVDALAPFGNWHHLPRGVLREPTSQAGRADAIIRTRADRGGDPGSLPMGIPVFSCTHKPLGLVEFQTGGQPEKNSHIVRHPLAWIKGKTVLAFSGIGDNMSFFTSLQELGGKVVKSMPFPDHHEYTDEDRRNILETARNLEVEALVTTEKDLARLGGWSAEGLPLIALEISMAFENEEAFERFLRNKLKIGAA